MADHAKAPSAQQSHLEITAFGAELNTDTPTVDLHGMTVDLALSTLDQAVNHHFIKGDETLRIIHGRGGGKLRYAMQKYLREQTELVAFFRDSTIPREQGGVTIVVLHSKQPR